MDGAIRYRIVSGAPARDVVARMVTGDRVGVPGEDRVGPFMNFLERYGIDVSRQAVAEIDGRPAGYCLCLVNPGHTAAVLLPERGPDLDRRYSWQDVATGVLKCLSEQLEAWDLAFMQAIVSDEGSPAARAFLAAGFSMLCRLVVMEAGVGSEGGEPRATEVTWVPFGAGLEERFSAAILASYAGSRDCPQLTGLRTGREVLAGHRASGLFEPAAWWLLQAQGRDAGVLLLNRTEEDADRLELIYMGLAPAVRGRGLGRELLAQAFEVARRLGMKVVRLAVDAENAPARALYYQHGFRPVGNQTVLAVLNEARRGRVGRGE